jgi:hypothetical protein
MLPSGDERCTAGHSPEFTGVHGAVVSYYVSDDQDPLAKPDGLK